MTMEILAALECVCVCVCAYLHEFIYLLIVTAPSPFKNLAVSST